MNLLMILIPVALGLGALGLWAFLWNLRSGQYEDLEGAAYRILDDTNDELVVKPDPDLKHRV
jgi:cbb3-type cytochrome oxidase maturation protein